MRSSLRVESFPSVPVANPFLVHRKFKSIIFRSGLFGNVRFLNNPFELVTLIVGWMDFFEMVKIKYRIN